MHCCVCSINSLPHCTCPSFCLCLFDFSRVHHIQSLMHNQGQCMYMCTDKGQEKNIALSSMWGSPQLALMPLRYITAQSILYTAFVSIHTCSVYVWRQHLFILYYIDGSSKRQSLTIFAHVSQLNEHYNVVMLLQG